MKRNLLGGQKLSTKNIINRKILAFSLESVKYKSIEEKQTKKEKSYKPVIKDNYQLVQVRDAEIEVEYTREVYFKPKAIMNTTIIISFIMGLDKEDDEMIKEDDILKELNDRKEDLLTAPASIASMIISNLTSITLPFPLVSLPFYSDIE